MELAIAIPLPDAAARGVVALQVAIAKQRGWHGVSEAHPHITLKLGFPATDVRPIEHYLEELSATIQPFDVEIQGVDFFDEGIVFLNVAANEHLERLRQRILRDLKAAHAVTSLPIEDSRFRFHVTLASGISKQDFQRLRKDLAFACRPVRFRMRKIELLCHTGNHWLINSRLPLARTDEATGVPIPPQTSAES